MIKNVSKDLMQVTRLPIIVKKNLVWSKFVKLESFEIIRYWFKLRFKFNLV